MADIDFSKAALAWTLPWDADWVTAVAFLGASRRLAAGNNLGQILFWDLPDKPGSPAPLPLRRLEGHSNVISRLLATPDGRSLVSASYDHTIRFWDMASTAAGEETVVLNVRTRAEAESPAGKRAGRKVPVALPAKVTTHKATRILEGHRDWIQGLVMTPDARTLASGDDSGTVIIWDRSAGKELRRWSIKGWAYAMALSPDGGKLFVAERLPLVFDSGQHMAARVWSVAEAKPKLELTEKWAKAYWAAAAFAPDGKALALGRGGETESGKIYLVDPENGKKRWESAAGHQYGVTDIAYHPSGKFIASSGRDTTIRIWQAADGKQIKELGKARGGQFKDWFHALSFSGDGRWLATADMAGQVHVWSLA